MHTEYTGDPPMWRSYAKKFTNIFPTFHDYVAKLKHEKQMEDRKVTMLRFKEKREEEILKEQEIAEEIKREKEQRLSELKEKIKETKERIRFHDAEQAKKREQTLNKKMQLMKQVILRRVQVYDNKNLEYWTPTNKTLGSPQRGKVGYDLSKRNMTEEAVKFDFDRGGRGSFLKLTSIGEDNADQGFYDFVNGKSPRRKKTEDIDVVLHDAQMLPKKPDADKFIRPGQQKYRKLPSFKKKESSLNKSVL